MAVAQGPPDRRGPVFQRSCRMTRAGRRHFRAWGIGLLAAWQLVAGVGISLPLPRRPAGGERFPCENCPCGCATAEHCWRNCCCFTPEQRLQWARQNGVPVPAFVQAAARSGEGPRAARCPHCVAAPPKAVPGAPLRTGAPVARSAPPNAGWSIVQAQRCRGFVEHWQVLAQGLPPRPTDGRPSSAIAAGRVAAARPPLRGLDAREPPTPPPRLWPAALTRIERGLRSPGCSGLAPVGQSFPASPVSTG